MAFEFITIVSVYGHTDGSEAIPSIMSSMQALPGSCGLLLSIRKPERLPENILWSRIFPMNYKQYSLFMMYGLDYHIKTDFCLTVQSDGFIANPEAWSEKFLQYDFIGALTPCAIKDNQFSGAFEWTKQSGKKFIMQNGGFSLRTKRLLGIFNKYGLVYSFQENSVLHNEDVQISGILRPQLQSLGVRFASEEDASNFSLEYYHPLLPSSSNLKNVFGTHKKFCRLKSTNHLEYSKPGLQTFGEDQYCKFLTGC